MKKLPLGIQTFKEIIENDYLYVDKTKEIYELISSGKYFFISRPRRFGKSLLISTLKEIFSGSQELFKGLWIHDKIEWKKHPVIHIDFSTISYKTPEILEKELSIKIKSVAEEYNVTITAERNFKGAFQELVAALSEIEKVVILIDEYDKPIIDFIENPDFANKNRDILKNFYEVIKGSDEYIRFAFLTGVSKFSKVSVFSGLNNLLDITMNEQFATIFGYTDSELETYFSDYLFGLAERFNLETPLLKREVKNWYNGYSWDGKSFVYNPYSILALFYHRDFGNYWFTSGTPTFLIKMIKKYNVDVSSFEKLEVGTGLFESFDIDNMNVESLLFQTGYLTIKKIVHKSLTRKNYILNYPNQEVKESFIQNLLKDFTGKVTTEVLIDKIAETLEDNNIEGFVTHLVSLFGEIPHHIFIDNREAYYHTIIYLVLTLVGVRITAEVHTNKGRVDAVIKTDGHIYIIEFKLGTAEKALEQIESMKYYQRYLASGKIIKLIGIGFDIEERNIKGYLVKELPITDK